MKTNRGLTLIEALISVVILGLMATGISAVYLSGLQSLEVQAERMLVDSALRSGLEVLVGRPFDEVLNEGGVGWQESLGGKTYNFTWSAALIDLDGDGTPEPKAMQITVSMTDLPGASLTTIVVDNEGKVGKIS